MRRLLLIDDDALLGPPLAAFFARFDFELQQATHPSEGLAMLAQGHFDAALLDVMLPDIDGFELCRMIRRSAGPQQDIPILMLTARGDVMDRVVGLELGADDYLGKPFEPRELLARIQTILRRRVAVPSPSTTVVATAPATAPASLQFDGLLIDLQRRSVQRHGEAVELTGTEFELLVLLATPPHRVHSRDEILASLRGHAADDIHSRAVDILVSRLRRKLEPLDVIRTLRNAGYLFAGGRS